MCSMTAGTRASFPSAIASASHSVAFSRNLSMRIGRSGDTSTAARTYSASSASSRLEAMPALGMGIFSLLIMPWNRSRSSARSIVSGDVPITRTPASSNCRAIFRGVWPPNWTITPSGSSFSIYEKEDPEGVIVQFGGQTPLNIARQLEDAGVRVIGTSPETIDLAEDRDRFQGIMSKLNIPRPEAGMASNLEEARDVATEIGYPVMVRPSYVLGGRAMEIVHDEEMLAEYVRAAVDVSPDRPILIDKFLENATECEADAIADGKDALVPAVMEHIEYAGVHSGDSACVIPPVTISEEHLAVLRDYTVRIAAELNVVGLMNIQYAISNGTVYVLEANPRASRTVPLVSKVCDVQMAGLATRVMLGQTLSDLEIKEQAQLSHFGVKEAVFPFNMFPEVDPLLGPEMRSTGEVLGMGSSFGLAFYKAQEAAKQRLPLEGTVLVTVAERDRSATLEARSTGEVLGMGSSFGLAFYKAQEAAKQRLPLEGTVLVTVAERDRSATLEATREFARLGFALKATVGTQAYLAENGISAEPILKLHEGRPNIEDAIKNGEIQLVVNTPAGKTSEFDDSYIRKAAIKYGVPYITTTAAAGAAARGIGEYRSSREAVRSLQSYHLGTR